MPKTKLSDQIIGDILRKIGSGEFKSERPLPSESHFCAIYGVNRGVIREAISALEAKGFVQVHQGSKSTVSPRYDWDVLDPIWVSVNANHDYYEALFKTREIIEPEIAYYAALNATKKDISELKRLLELYQNCTDSTENRAKLDAEFHKTLSRATKNPILNQLHNAIANLGVLSRTIALGLHEDEVVHRGIKGHEKIIDLIEAREPELARASMLIHLSESKQDVNNAILKQTLEAKNLSAGLTILKV
jgi:DNA-binding FadR family transcriptional regulator